MSKRVTPEELLSRCEDEDAVPLEGRLKVFLGYASGVGKSFRMFDEGRRRRDRGQDVIVGATQPRNSPEIVALLPQLEILPMRVVAGVPVVDVPAILARHPQVCLIDGLAHDNPPGHSTAHRWQDVQRLLEGGVSVITTINLKFVSERRDQLGDSRDRESVPESFLREADEMEAVDAPLTTGDKILSERREIALLLAADVVDHQLERYLERNGVGTARGGQERILVWLTARSNAARMIDRAQIARQRFHGVLYAIHVENGETSESERAALEQNLAIARRAQAQIIEAQGEDDVQAVVEFAKNEGITQIYMGQRPISSWQTWVGRTPMERLIAAVEGIDVKLFPQ